MPGPEARHRNELEQGPIKSQEAEGSGRKQRKATCEPVACLRQDHVQQRHGQIAQGNALEDPWKAQGGEMEDGEGVKEQAEQDEEQAAASGLEQETAA